MPGAGTFVFYGLSALVLGGAAGVAFSRDILRAAFLLLASLAGIAGLYLYVGADFVGVIQILIYVGGVLVLLLFSVLLTNRIGDVPVTNQSLGRVAAVPVAALVGLLLVTVAASTRWPRTEPVAVPTTARLGEAFLREYLLPFELASLVLLMALVGAMVIARRALRGDEGPGAGPAGQEGDGSPAADPDSDLGGDVGVAS